MIRWARQQINLEKKEIDDGVDYKIGGRRLLVKIRWRVEQIKKWFGKAVCEIKIHEQLISRG